MTLLLCISVFAKFLWDFVFAVIQVISWVFRSNRNLKPALVRMPLDIRSEWGLWILSLIIFLVPGSLIAKLETDRHRVYLHFFHTEDPDASVARLKSRFEKPLMRIFGEAP